MHSVDTLVFEVQGSAAEPYVVRFQRMGGRIAASCTCPAGKFHTLCKHRLQILDGNKKGVISPNADEAIQVKDWIKGTAIESTLQELASIEQQMETLKKQLDAAKKSLGKVML